MKYKVEVGSLCTRFVPSQDSFRTRYTQRKISLEAENEIEAQEKAIDKFVELEMKLSSSVDAGTPRVNSVSAEN